MHKEVKDYLKKVDGVSHMTFDPDGPGSVRVHLIPPKKVKIGTPWVVILNGYDVLPVSTGWAVIIREFMNCAVKYEGLSLDDNLEKLIQDTVIAVNRVFIKTKATDIKKDLKQIITTLLEIAQGKVPNIDIGYMDLKSYAKYMTAPHRMDLMISGMAKDGKWHCNQKCLHCYAGEQNLAVKEELSTEGWIKIIKKLRKSRVSQITFTGGEPTLRSDLVTLVKEASWFVTRLNTNGIKLTKELCMSLKEASLDAVQVTLYSDNENIHNFLVGSNHFNDTIEGIKNAIEAGLNVSINTPLCTLNKDYVKTITFASSLGVKFFSTSGLIETGNSLNDEAMNTYLTKDELYNVLKEAKAFADEANLDLIFTSPGWLDHKKCKSLDFHTPSCGACLSNMAVAPNGDVIPCQSHLSDEPLGNLLKEPFNKIWDNKKTKEIRSKVLKLNDTCLLQVREVK